MFNVMFSSIFSALPDLEEEDREADTIIEGGDRTSKKASSIHSSEKDKGWFCDLSERERDTNTHRHVS